MAHIAASILASLYLLFASASAFLALYSGLNNSLIVTGGLFTFLVGKISWHKDK